MEDGMKRYVKVVGLMSVFLLVSFLEIVRSTWSNSRSEHISNTFLFGNPVMFITR